MVLAPLIFHIVYLIIGTNSIGSEAGLNEKYIQGDNTDVAAAMHFLKAQNLLAADDTHKATLSSWKYENNLTEHNKQAMLKAKEISAAFTKESWINATSFKWKDFKGKNDTVYRRFKSLSLLGSAALPPAKFTELNEIVADMMDIYSTAKVCPFNATKTTPCELSLEPDITEILISSRNYDELASLWVQFRDQTGKKMREKYLRYVELNNECAKLNGFSDSGEFWRENYESDTFEHDVENLLKTLKPFYEQLHAYVRRKLIEQYKGHIKPDGPIPAHLLGNMWAQTWNNILDLLNPYPNEPLLDVTDTMIKKKMTPLKMFQTAEEFFTSLGLIKMTPQFWNNSVIEKPENREIVCHASAWDFYRRDDVRIKMCTRVNMEDLITVHHEMGHIEYYLQYQDQPVAFRGGANPGFHEAVGDTLALSASTPVHWHKIGMLDELVESEKGDINFLLLTALQKLAFLPFGYLIDNYRWKVFRGDIKPDELNTKWWELRLKHQGLCPPVLRTESDFDPGAKYHVPGDVPYIRYFVSFVIQFEFHKALCEESGHKGPLHKCDIYRSKKAGELLSKMLRLGCSVPWNEAMSVITKGRTNKMDAGAILDYFAPLMKWLKEKNKGEYIGWKSDNATICP